MAIIDMAVLYTAILPLWIHRLSISIYVIKSTFVYYLDFERARAALLQSSTQSTMHLHLLQGSE